MEDSAEYSRSVVHMKMIDLHALLMNNLEHRVFSIEPTAVHRFLTICIGDRCS